MAPNNGLLKSLDGKVSEIYAIGDCREPKLIVDAIADGSRIARAVLLTCTFRPKSSDSNG
ncbi:hypothetical protein ACFLXC_01910 [Chloroflexota bacterium]